ncbi:MAG: leucyl aminopeptidase family protein [Gammaproteobacteria bacterium]|nr:leucyl aminopeptidase family protein [Gammaproteobacteria bacterium]
MTSEIERETAAPRTASTGSGPALPLWLLREEEFAAWLAARPAHERRWITGQGFAAERDRTLLVPDADGAPALAVAGLGKRAPELSFWQAAGAADRLPPRRYVAAQEWNGADATRLALGFAYAAYRFGRYRQAIAPAASIEPPRNAALAEVERTAEALAMARDWINTPAGDFGPAELAAAARAVARRNGAKYREWVGDELLSAGLRAIHAVGRASVSPPRLIELRWSPPGAERRVILVGKGVCFDSGGLDIKPSTGMALMKKDMGGAAVALALAHLSMRAGLRAEIVVLIPAVENAIGGNAYRPGDVLTTHKGLSVEVGNTDAEGRLVLCDALSLADAEGADLILDFATLTGAARVALGPELPALFGTDPDLVRQMERAGSAEHDPLWPMPLWAPYAEELSSKVADLSNVAASSFAGAIFGALFLQRFVSLTPRWLHLDLYAWNPRERPGRPVGAEPQALRAAYRLLADRYGVA